MKKAAYGLVGLIVLLVAAALIVPSLIDWNAYKPEITAQVKKATGRTLEITGDLDFAVLPTPHLNVSNARLANAQGATAAHMVLLKELRVSVKLTPLLRGNIEIASVVLVEPVIELEKLPGGKMNWEFSPPGPTPIGAAGSKPSSAATNDRSDRQAFKLDSMRIENGTIVYRDTPAGTIEKIENLTADLSAGSLAGPFTLKGGLTGRNIPLTVDARIGKFAEKGALSFQFKFGTPRSKANIGLKGTVTDLETMPSVVATLNGSGDDLGVLVSSLSGSAPMPQLGQPFAVTASIGGSKTAVSVEDLVFKIGKSSATGTVKVALNEIVRADVSLQMKSLDADAFLTAGRRPAMAGGAVSRKTDAGKLGSGITPTAQKIVLPRDVEATFELAINEVIAKKNRVRDVRLSASLKDGGVQLKTLTAEFPGGGKLAASGTMTAPQGALSYGGKVSYRSANLRNFLEWLEIDVAAVPADRLRRFNLSADIDGNSAQVQVANIVSQLDASRMSGGVTVALRDRLAFGASVNIDQFNADAYMAAPGPVKTGAAAEKTPQRAPGGVENDPPENPLAVLNKFDANFALRVGSLSYQQTAIQGVRLDGTLINNVLTLRDASVQSLAGTSARVKGTVTGLSGIPAFKGTIVAASDDLTGLFKIAGLKSPVPARKLGKMRLSSTTDVSKDRLQIDASLQIAEIRAKITGNVTGIPLTPVFDVTLDAQHPELARLANLFADGKPGPAAGRVGLKFNLKGESRVVAVTANGSVAGGSFRISGTVGTPLETPELDVDVDLRHPNFVRLVKAFDPGFRPANPRLGALSLAAKLQGTDRDLTIKDLSGNIGPTKISGSGSYKDGASRPDLRLALTSSVIPLSDFLEAPRGGASGDAQLASTPARKAPGPSRPISPGRPGQKWSTDPIDTTAFGLVNANIDLSAAALLYKTFRIDKPQIVAVLKDRVLNIERISGTMFDGGFEMSGRVDGRGVPAASTSLTITKANVGNALFQAAEFDIATGVLTFGMNLTARGKSQKDMIGALNGKGRIDVVNGVVKGFDLKKVSDSLKNLNQLTGLLGILGGAMGGGSTRFSSLNGNFNIDKGIMRTTDLRLVADAGAGNAAGFVDLPRWNMDMQSEFRMTEHPSAPPFRVRAVGPPDNPRRLFDFQSLQAWVLQQGVGSFIKSLLPGFRNKSGSQQQQQQKPKVEDVLKGLLKGFGR